jgi:hypothetical protein
MYQSFGFNKKNILHKKLRFVTSGAGKEVNRYQASLQDVWII